MHERLVLNGGRVGRSVESGGAEGGEKRNRWRRDGAECGQKGT